MGLKTVLISPVIVRKIANKPVKVGLDAIPAGRFVAEPKLDGERVLLRVGPDGSGYMANKYGRTYGPEDLSWLANTGLPTGLYDGELYFENGTVYDLMKAVRSGIRRENLVLYLFDVLEYDGADVRQMELLKRKEMLERAVRNADEHIRPVEYVLVESKDEVRSLFSKFISSGHEGLVLKGLGPYWDTWYKLKRSNIVNLVVLGFKKTGEWRKRKVPMSFLLGHYDAQARQFRPLCYASSGLPWSVKAAIGSFFLEKCLLRGEDNEVVYVEPLLVLEVEFQEKGPNGKLRSPRIRRLRWDLRPEECTLS